MFDELNKNINYDECLGFNDEKQIQLTEWRNGAVLAAIATDKQALSFALKICFVPFYVPFAMTAIPPAIEPDIGHSEQRVQ